MKVWQAGSHLTDERGARVDDWTWAQTRRRLGVLVRLARPYQGRTALALVTLVAYTVVALLPPYLAKLAVDDGITAGDLRTLTIVVVAFLAAGIAAFVLSGAPDLLHRLGRRAGARRSPDPALPPPAAPFARLLRAQPHGRDREPDHERRRGARPARHRRDLEPRPELASSSSEPRRPLHPRLAPRPRDPRRPPADGRSRPRGSDRARTARTGACASGSGSSPQRSPRTSPGCASCSRSRASRRAR